MNGPEGTLQSLYLHLKKIKTLTICSQRNRDKCRQQFK